MALLIKFDGCHACSLKKDWDFLRSPRMPIATPKEPSPYKVILVGEAPGKTEDNEGRPFVGDAGQYLRNVIPEEWKNKLYWGNSVRCRPTENGSKNRTPTIQEIDCCSTYLRNDLNAIQPHAILALGDIALKRFYDTAWVTGMRGLPFPVQLANGITTWCVPTFHPSYVMRQDRKDYDTGITSNTMLPVFRNDIKNFFSKVPFFAENPPKICDIKTEIQSKILYPKTPGEVFTLFQQLKEPYALDIETFKLKPYKRDARILTAAFSDGDLTFAFPVNWPGQLNNWGLDIFNKIMLIAKRWIAQHASFEYAWVWSSTKTYKHDFDDIEVLARLLHKRSGVGSLDDLSRIYLGADIKAYSAIDKNRLLDYPIEKVLEYNAIDAWAERLIYDILLRQLTQEDLGNYHRILDAIKSTVAMEIYGLTVDQKASEGLQKEFYGKMQEFEQKARNVQEVIQFERDEHKIFKLSAPETVGHVLVSYCFLDLPKTPKNQQYSTDEKNLAPLAGQHKLVDIVLDFREVAKLLSTYIDPILSGSLLGTDGLIHPAYTVIHTRTYRLSAEDPNIQNFPKRSHKEIRKQIVAPKGYILGAFDYGQLEGRVIAMFSKDANLKKAFIEEEDIHWKWLYRIIDLYPQYLDRLAKISHETKEEKILKAGRTIIKTDFVFASFYGSQAPSLAKRTQIPLHITEQVLEEFWSAYPATKIWVDNQSVKYQDTGQVESITGRVRNEVLPGNEISNSPVQGSAAEIVLEAQNYLSFRALTEDIHLLPRINIHDDILFILPDSNDLIQYITTIGQEIVKPRFDFVTVPLMTEARVGYNWSELEAVTNFVGEYF